MDTSKLKGESRVVEKHNPRLPSIFQRNPSIPSQFFW